MAFDIDEMTGKLFVLNKTPDAVSFAHYRLNFVGNVAPNNYFSGPELNGVVSFRVDPVQSEVYFVDYINVAIKIYQLYVDPVFHSSQNSTQIKRSLHGQRTLLISPVDLALSEQEIFVLDGDRVLVFAKSAQGDVSPVRIISGTNTQILSAKMINLDLDANEILVINGDEQTLRFYINANGNIAPLP